MTRQIFFDTETTGLDADKGDRIIEIGCIEMVDRRLTGNTLHVYLNPERSSHPDAVKVHGLTDEFLADKPLFAQVADDFLAFIADDPLVIHNASFDIGFLNAELERASRPLIARDRLVDTLLLARRKHPGQSNKLDDLCARYGIDNSKRTLHGALLDSELLAEVYIELTGARQAQLVLSEDRVSAQGAQNEASRRTRTTPLAPRLSLADLKAHADFVATLGDKPLWREFIESEKDPSAN